MCGVVSVVRTRLKAMSSDNDMALQSILLCPLNCFFGHDSRGVLEL